MRGGKTKLSGAYRKDKWSSWEETWRTCGIFSEDFYIYGYNPVVINVINLIMLNLFIYCPPFTLENVY